MKQNRIDAKKIMVIGITAVLILLAAILLAAPAEAAAPSGTAYPVTGGKIYIDNGVVTGFTGDVTRVTFPAGVTVTKIGDKAFYDCTLLERITLPNTLEEIGEEAFYYCPYLESITLPESLEKIGAKAFCYTGLKMIEIPKNVSNIGNDAFLFCNDLKYAEFEEGSALTRIPDCMFAQTGLTSVVFPEGIEEIGAEAFSGTYLTNIVIPKSVSVIGEGAFSYCPNLLHVEFEAGSALKSLPYKMFTYSGLTSIVLPDSLEEIGGSAFSSSNLKDVEIPKAVSSIGIFAFSRCENLESVVFEEGSSLTVLPQGVFEYSGLISIILPDSLEEIGSSVFYECDRLTNITVPSSVSKVGVEVFTLCYNLESVEFEEGSNLKSITQSMFNSSGLTSIVLPDSLEEIERFAFCKTNLKNITIPETVSKIDSRAFWHCLDLEQVTIPKNVSTFGEEIFIESTALTASVYPGSDALDYVRANDVSYIIIGGTLTESNLDIAAIDEQIYTGSKINPKPAVVFTAEDGTIITLDPETDYTISYENNQEIGTATLIVTGKNGYSGSVSASFEIVETGRYYLNEEKTQWLTYTSDGTITGHGYTGTDYITEVTIPETIKSVKITAIGAKCFYNASYLTAVTIPESVTTIGTSAFYGCTSLNNIRIPNSVTKIYSEAFSNCTALETVVLSTRLTSIDLHVFSSCTKLASVKIPEGVTTIGMGAFSYCVSMETVTLPDGLKDINQRAFYSCKSLKYIEIPASVTRIQSDAFSEHMQVHFKGNAPVISQYSFYFTTPLYFYCNADTTNAEGMRYTIYRNHTYENGFCTECYERDPDAVIELTDANVKIAEIPQMYYTGEEIKPEPKVAFYADGSKKFYLVQGTDFVYKYENNINAGEYSTVIIEGINKYSGSVSAEFDILPVTLSNGTITTEYSEYIYSGYPINPEITVVVDGKTLTKFEDYRLSYSNNTEIGTGSVTVTGINNYYGSLTVTFKIITDDLIYYLDDEHTQWLVYTADGEIIDYGYEGDNCITNLEIPGKIGNIAITTIAGDCFRSDINLKSVVIGDGIKEIGEYAFVGCSNLTSAVIGEGAEIIEESAFSGCSSLIELSLPSTLKHLRMYAFRNCTSLNDVNLPEGLSSIGDSAFEECGSLESIVIPDSVVYLYDGAFRKCDSLSSVKLPTGISWIGSLAFNGCTSLKTIDIPANVIQVGDSAFTGITELVVNFEGDAPQLKDYPNYGYLAFPEGTVMNFSCTADVTNLGSRNYIVNRNHSYVNNICIGCGACQVTGGIIYIENGVVTGYEGEITHVTIPVGVTVTKIGRYAFENCTTLESIVLPDTLKEIESHAFSGCSKLSSILIPKTVTDIGAGAFFDCSRLKQVEFEAGSALKTLQTETFRETGLTSINLPDSLEQIDSYAFFACNSLTTITIPKKVTTIGVDAFNACNYLTEVEFEEGSVLNTIGSYAFKNCRRLKSINLPGSLEIIDISAFYNCRNLTSITIPKSVTNIGIAAFSEITGMEVNFEGEAPSIDESTFEPGSKWYFYCTVDTSHLETYGCEVVTKHSYTDGVCTACGDVIYTLGDIDLDGDIDASDLTVLARHVAGIVSLTDLRSQAAADVTFDGDISAEDLTRLAQHVAGIISNWK